MPQTQESLVLITRYLNNPYDLTFQQDVDKFRSGSSENDSYFLEIERIWKFSKAAELLEKSNRKQAVKNINAILRKQHPNNFRWWKSIAATLLLVLGSYAIYYQYTTVSYTTTVTSTNEVDSVKLADGSIIILSENSSITYPDKFIKNREISLTKGQAFFKIIHDTEHPFKVIINKSDITVLGTSFNINLFEAKINLGVITGKVSFSPYANAPKHIISAGDAISYDVLDRKIIKKNGQNSAAWLTKQLVFVDTPLDEVCEQLTAYYGENIKLQDKNHSRKKLNASFKSQTLDEVLAILNETYSIKINKQQNQINLITP